MSETNANKKPSVHSTPAGDEEALEEFAESEGGAMTDKEELIENAEEIKTATDTVRS